MGKWLMAGCHPLDGLPVAAACRKRGCDVRIGTNPASDPLQAGLLVTHNGDRRVFRSFSWHGYPDDEITDWVDGLHAAADAEHAVGVVDGVLCCD